MELQAFRTLLMERVRAFDKWVREDIREVGEDWSKGFNQADWEEQFIMFGETQ